MANVPNVPGVPPLSSYATFGGSLLLADAIQVISAFLNQTSWGLFLDGLPIITTRIIADSVLTFDFRQDWGIADYPLEQGSFESYNKVKTPFLIRIRFTKGGSVAERQLLLDTVAAVSETLDLYDVVTPEAIYQSVNIAHYDYHRTSQNGVGLLVVDMWALQVRVTAQTQFSNTKSASSRAVQSGGTVQPIEPSREVTQSFQGTAVQ